MAVIVVISLPGRVTRFVNNRGEKTEKTEELRELDYQGWFACTLGSKQGVAALRVLILLSHPSAVVDSSGRSSDSLPAERVRRE